MLPAGRRVQFSDSVEGTASLDVCSPAYQMAESPMTESPSNFKMRMTTTLNDKGMLRATRPSVILAQLGARLRSNSAGGIGAVANSAAEDEYKRSFAVDHIDIFLSHSWHAQWVLKYLTLLFYFNAVPSIAVTLVMSTLVCVHAWPYTEQDGLGPWLDTPAVPFVLPVGGFVYLLTLCGWHHFVDFFQRGQCVFFDKVCIHQTNHEQKAAGIKALGAFLSKSSEMLVAWDNSYFERLWCTFEISAYLKSKSDTDQQDGHIVVMPVVLGGVAAAYVAASAVGETVASISNIWVPSGSKREGVITGLIHALVYLPMLIYTSRMFLRYSKDLRRIGVQLSNFSIRHAKCFCCDNQHRHPDTGIALPCDRDLVYSSIAHWHGDDNVDDGLNKFDELVRNEFCIFLRESLGGWCKVPFHFAVAASIFPGLHALDMTTCTRKPYYKRCVLVLETIFLRNPLIIAMVMALVMLSVRWHGHRLESSRGKWITVIACGCIICTVKFLMYTITLLVMAYDGRLLLWISIEAFAVVVCYWSPFARFEKVSARTANIPRSAFGSLPDSSFRKRAFNRMRKLTTFEQTRSTDVLEFMCIRSGPT